MGFCHAGPGPVHACCKATDASAITCAEPLSKTAVAALSYVWGRGASLPKLRISPKAKYMKYRHYSTHKKHHCCFHCIPVVSIVFHIALILKIKEQ